MLTRLIPTDGNDEEYVHTSSGLLTIIDIPWLIDASAFMFTGNFLVHISLSQWQIFPSHTDTEILDQDPSY